MPDAAEARSLLKQRVREAILSHEDTMLFQVLNGISCLAPTHLELTIKSDAVYGAFTTMPGDALTRAVLRVLEGAEGSVELQAIPGEESHRLEFTGPSLRHEMTVPAAPPPTWFAEKLSIPEGANFVSIDDEPLIHDVWRVRLADAHLAAKKLEKVFLRSPEELKRWLGAAVPRRDFFVCDLQFKGAAMNGLQALSALGLQRSAVLMTGMWDDPATQALAMSAGIKILPKELLGMVPIEIIS